MHGRGDENLQWKVATECVELLDVAFVECKQQMHQPFMRSGLESNEDRMHQLRQNIESCSFHGGTVAILCSSVQERTAHQPPTYQFTKIVNIFGKEGRDG